jgi:ribosomal-protein-alanine acetyltransferase
LSWKKQIRDTLFRLLGKDPEAVVVSFATGPEDRVRAMADEVRALIPGRRHFLVSTGPAPPVEGMEPVALRPAGVFGLLRQLRKALGRYRIGMAPLLLGFEEHAALRRAAMLYAPLKILAYNRRLERHHLRLGCPVASALFARGVPLDRIYLRPPGLEWTTGDRGSIPDDAVMLEGRAARGGRRRIGVLSPFSPYPLSHGGAVRLWNLLREMAKEFDVYLFFFREQETAAGLRPLLEFVTAIGMVTKPRYRRPRWASLAPPEVLEYESPPMRRLLDRAIRERGIELMQIEYTQLGNYAGNILVEHDVTFDLYAQIRERTPSLAAWWDWKRWLMFETKAVERYRRVVTMSPKDAGMLGIGHVRVIPNGVDLDRYQPQPEAAGHRLLFVGSFRHFPNVTAFRFFLEQVWPLVKEADPDVTVEVVAGPDPGLHWEGPLPADPRFQIHGFVADVRPLYDRANVVLTPTLVSAGTNVKVLEAMAMERAIVSTSSGVGGIAVEHGTHVWIADTPRDFADGIIRLIHSSSLRRRLAEAGRRLVAEHYGWVRLGEMQRALIREALPGDIIVRRGTSADLAGVRQIQAQSLPTSRWDPEHYLRHEFYVGVYHGEMAGFIVARRTAPDEREILNIAVQQNFRGNGVGEKLLRRLIDSEAGEVFLEVRESNHIARRLYERTGFRNVGTRPDYYDDPPETAVIMRVQTPG